MSPKREKTYECGCDLRPGVHLVPVSQKIQHEKEGKLEVNDARTPVNSLASQLGTLTLSAERSTDPLLGAFDKLSLEDATSVADMTTALALTDDGPNPAEQPSKFFTSRASFQKSRAPHHPTSFTPVPITEASRSIHAILADSPSRKRVDKCQERSLNVLAEIKKLVEIARSDLKVEFAFCLDDPEHVAHLRSKVDAASGVAVSAEESLERVGDSEEKEDVIGRLRALELQITYLGAVLPQPTTPYHYDSTTFLKMFEGPVPGQLFIDRGTRKRLRLPYGIFSDFFNPNGLRKRGNHDSVGILSAVNLALPLSLQHKPEYTYVCLIGGPKEPSVEQMNGYLRIIVAWS
ncbi:hypothetical protein K438DRAFT_1768823 [Mycena galopus ATCC 62051]|nr:hypothetical protein K438DRAFT_1768823 [Mycena galopus ATCC 62051]